MPELPEVETICRALRSGGRDAPPIIGWTIARTSLLWEKTLDRPEAEVFSSRLPGSTVMDVQRRAKFIDIHLTGGHLLIHLRMSGDIRVEPDPKPLQPHDRLVIWFTNGYHLAFNDTRKFGRVWFVEDPQEVLEKLGPEPLTGLSPAGFYGLLQRHNRQIKPLLMDQRVIAGLGNIYSDEALFLAGIHPLRKSSTISAGQAKKLLKAIQSVLEKGIETNGASIDWIYRGGEFQLQLQVYNRAGEECYRCGSGIVKIRVGQRGTHFCPHCQPES